MTTTNTPDLVLTGGRLHVSFTDANHAYLNTPDDAPLTVRQVSYRVSVHIYKWSDGSGWHIGDETLDMSSRGIEWAVSDRLWRAKNQSLYMSRAGDYKPVTPAARQHVYTLIESALPAYFAALPTETLTALLAAFRQRDRTSIRLQIHQTRQQMDTLESEIVALQDRLVEVDPEGWTAPQCLLWLAEHTMAPNHFRDRAMDWAGEVSRFAAYEGLSEEDWNDSATDDLRMAVRQLQIDDLDGEAI